MGNQRTFIPGFIPTLILLVILNSFSVSSDVRFQNEDMREDNGSLDKTGQQDVQSNINNMGSEDIPKEDDHEIIQLEYSTIPPDMPNFYENDISTTSEKPYMEIGEGSGIVQSKTGPYTYENSTNPKEQDQFSGLNNSANLHVSSGYTLPPPEIQARNNLTVRVVFLGRSGSGISSTIQNLIGQKSECTKPNGNETLKNIMVYTISDSTTSTDQVQLVDVPGFVDGRNVEQDSQILASLKSYIQSEGHPDFYVVLSRFDDNRFDGVHSLFVQSLKRVELFQNTFVNNTITNEEDNRSNIVYLFTRLMSETKSTQRRPESKMRDFQRTIQKYTALQTPFSIVVGDNHAESEYGAKVEKGYYKLPNKELYPKNIWQALINASTVNNTTESVLTSIMNNRETQMKCKAELIPTEWEYYSDDVDAFSYLLTLSNTTIENNDINNKIQEAFENKNSTRAVEIVQKIALQLRLQQKNITAIDHLPKSLTEQAKFFQQNKQFSASIPAGVLNEAFQLQMPEYIHRLTVGYGYVVTEDDISPRTPFDTSFNEPSSVGYKLPNFMKCRKLFSPEIEYFKSYSVNMSDYVEKRLQHLHFVGNGNITTENSKWKVKEGYNLQPEKGDNVVTLTAVEEHRTLTCNLVSDPSQWVLDYEFIAEVNALVDFNTHDKETVSEWTNWFEKWGSHVVTQGYGGGALHGSLVGTNVKKVLESSSTIDQTLTAIVEYTPFPVPDLGVPAYRLYGGESESNSENLYALAKEQRENLIKKWEDTLTSDFKMLFTEFRLEPISMVVKEKLGPERGEMVEKAIDSLLKGELKYVRKSKKRKNQTTTSNQNRRNEGVVESIQTPATPTVSYADRENSYISSSTEPPKIEQTNNLLNQTATDDGQGRNLTRFEIRAQEQQHLAQQTTVQMATNMTQSSTNRRTYFQAMLDNLDRSNKQQEEAVERQIEEMNRKTRLAEEQNQMILTQITKNKEKQQEKQQEKSFWKFLTGGTGSMRQQYKDKQTEELRHSQTQLNCTTELFPVFTNSYM